MKKILILLLLPVLNQALYAQVTFQERIGTVGGQRGYSVEQTADGGYIISGLTYNAATGIDILLVKTGPTGNVQWSRDFAGAGDDESFSVRQTSDGGYVLTGRTESFSAGDYDVFLVKTDGNGDTLWTKRYSTAKDDYSMDVQQTSDGGYIIAGYTPAPTTIYDEVLLIKTDANGDTLWTRIYGSASNERAYSVRQNADGGYIISGYMFIGGLAADEVYVIRTDAAGDTLWTRSYGAAPGDDWAFCAQQTADGGFAIGGYTEGFGSGSHDLLLIKTDANGDTLWCRAYGGANSDYPYTMQQTADGGFLIGGTTFSFGSGNADMYMVKTDANGDTL